MTSCADEEQRLCLLPSETNKRDNDFDDFENDRLFIGVSSVRSYGGCTLENSSEGQQDHSSLDCRKVLPRQRAQQEQKLGRNVIGLIRRLSSRISFSVTVSPTCSQDLSSVEVYNDCHEYEGNDSVSRPSTLLRRLDWKKVVLYLKYTYSFALLTFCIWVIACGIYAVQTPVTQSVHWIVALVMMWVLILWLGQLEGGQGCLVGLQPIPISSYIDTHPSTYKCTVVTYNGNNLNRFIVGRQFLVVIVVFGLNFCCSVVKGATVPGLSHAFVDVFLESGMAILIVTVIIGQLAAEVCATGSMLDFINTPVMIVTTWLCLTIEASGLLHAVYLVQCAAEYCSGARYPSSTQDSDADNVQDPSTLAGSTAKSKESMPFPRQKTSFWAKVLLSVLLLTYFSVQTLTALIQHQTTMYEGTPAFVSVVILLLLIGFLGIMEAMQIALFAVVNLPKIDFDVYPRAKFNCDLAFSGSNFQAFLIGRQICVTMSMFLLARVTTTRFGTTGDLGGGEDNASATHVSNMSSQIEDFFNTGLPGAFITTVVASLAWRIFASCFPMAFLNSVIVYPTIRLCLFLESTGIFSTAWIFAKGLKIVLGLRPDEDYIGPLLISKDISKSDEETVSQTSSFSSM